MNDPIRPITLALATALIAFTCWEPAAAQDADEVDADPRIGLGAGLFDAEEAIWNLRKLKSVPPPEAFVGSVRCV